MTEDQSRERKMSRAEAVRLEMASAVRFLGEGGQSAKEQNTRAAREAGLRVEYVERLRWKKLSRVPADVADMIREAVARKQAKVESRARHEITILAARLQALETRFQTTDPEFHSFDVAPHFQPAGYIGAQDRSGSDAAATLTRKGGRS